MPNRKKPGINDRTSENTFTERKSRPYCRSLDEGIEAIGVSKV